MQKQETGNVDRLAGQSSDNLQEIDEEQLGVFRSLVRSFSIYLCALCLLGGSSHLESR